MRQQPWSAAHKNDHEIDQKIDTKFDSMQVRRRRRRIIFIADAVGEKKIKLAHLTRPSVGSSLFSVTRFKVKARRFRCVAMKMNYVQKIQLTHIIFTNYKNI